MEQKAKFGIPIVGLLIVAAIKLIAHYPMISFPNDGADDDTNEVVELLKNGHHICSNPECGGNRVDYVWSNDKEGQEVARTIENGIEVDARSPVFVKANAICFQSDDVKMYSKASGVMTEAAIQAMYNKIQDYGSYLCERFKRISENVYEPIEYSGSGFGSFNEINDKDFNDHQAIYVISD